MNIRDFKSNFSPVHLESFPVWIVLQLVGMWSLDHNWITWSCSFKEGEIKRSLKAKLYSWLPFDWNSVKHVGAAWLAMGPLLVPAVTTATNKKPCAVLNRLCWKRKYLIGFEFVRWFVQSPFHFFLNFVFLPFFEKGIPISNSYHGLLFRWACYHGCVKRFNWCIGFSGCAQNAEFMQFYSMCLVLNYCQSNSKKNLDCWGLWFIIY